MTVYFNDSPALTVAVHARQTTPSIVSGSPGTDSNTFIETIKGLLPETPMTIVDNEQQMITFPSFDVQHAGS